MADDPSTLIYRTIWDNYLFPKNGALQSEFSPANRYSEIERQVFPPEGPVTSQLPYIYLSQGDLNGDIASGNATTDFKSTFEILVSVDLGWTLAHRNTIMHKVIKALSKGKPSLGLDMVTDWTFTAKTIFKTTEDTGEVVSRGFRITITVDYTLTDAELQS